MRVGAGERVAWPRSTPGLGGTTGLECRGWPGGPPAPWQAPPRRGGSFRAGDRPSRNKRAIPPSRIAPGEAAEGTFPRPTPALPPARKKWEKRRAPGALFPLSSSWVVREWSCSGWVRHVTFQTPKRGRSLLGTKRAAVHRAGGLALKRS